MYLTVMSGYFAPPFGACVPAFPFNLPDNREFPLVCRIIIGHDGKTSLANIQEMLIFADFFCILEKLQYTIKMNRHSAALVRKGSGEILYGLTASGANGSRHSWRRRYLGSNNLSGALVIVGLTG